MNIQPVVEGHGEVDAVPVLLRRLRDFALTFPLEVNPPIRRHASDFLDETKVKQAVRIALKQEDCDAILLMFDGDGDDDCPRDQAPTILGWAQAEAAGTPCFVVMAYREYESWFLASIESLRGCRGIRQDSESHPQPEVPRGAKEQIEDRMETSRSYRETADQAAMTALFDMEQAYRKCRSFKHLVSVFGQILQAFQLTPEAWPPPQWLQ